MGVTNRLDFGPGEPTMISVVCGNPRCRKVFNTELGRIGRPKFYCSESCSKKVRKLRAQCRARIAHYEALIKRERHWLAALGDDEGTGVYRARAERKGEQGGGGDT
jgi:hypothetical protein